jgi:hypothetical protein
MAGAYEIEAESAERALEIVQRLPDGVQPENGFTLTGTQNIDEDGIYADFEDVEYEIVDDPDD